LFTLSHGILTRRKNHFSQSLNVHGVNNVEIEIEIHTADPLVPELSAFEVEMVIENLKGHKSLLNISQQDKSLQKVNY
jgi:hypothetical protein